MKPWGPVSRLFGLSKSKVAAASEDQETVSLTALPPGPAEGSKAHLPSDSLQCVYGGSCGSVAESLLTSEQAIQQSPQPYQGLSEATQHVPHSATSPATTQVSKAASSPAPVAAAPHAASISPLPSSPPRCDPSLSGPSALPSPQLPADSISSFKPASPATSSTMRRCPTNPLFGADGKDNEVESPTKPSLIQKMEATHQAMLRQQLEHFRRELAAVEADLSTRHQHAVEALQAQHAAKLAAVVAKHSQQVAELKAKLRAVSGELQRLRRLQQEESTLPEPQVPAQLVLLERQVQQGGYMRLASRDRDGSQPRLPAERRRRLTLGSAGPVVQPAAAVAALPGSLPGQQLQQKHGVILLPATRQQEGQAAAGKSAGGQAAASGAASRRDDNKAAQLQSRLWAVASQLSRPQEIEEGNDDVAPAQHAQRTSKARLLQKAARAQAAGWTTEQDEGGEQQQEQRAPFARANKHGANQAADLSERLRAAMWQSQGGRVRHQQHHHHDQQPYHRQHQPQRLAALEQPAGEEVAEVAVHSAEQTSEDQQPQLASKHTVQQECPPSTAGAAATLPAGQEARLPSLGRKPSKERLGGAAAVSRSPLLARNV